MEVHPQTKKLLVYLKVDPDTVELEDGFSRDVRNIGHFGTGDLELRVKTREQLEKALPLIHKSYEASLMAITDSRRLVDKLWSYCNVLRDDGVGVIEYTEQLTYLLFLKMAHERATRKLKPQQIVPEEYSWQRLLDAEGTQLEFEYTRILVGLAQQPGTLGTIFRKAQNRIQDPAKLKRLIVDLIDKEHWSASGTDIKGDAYEELLSKGASDKGSGAGQYFTPRELIHAMVDVIQPTPDDTVVDPACGTGGFLLVAHEYAAQGAENLTPTQRDNLRDRLRERLRTRRRHCTACSDEPAAPRHRHRRRRLTDRRARRSDRRPGQALVGRACRIRPSAGSRRSRWSVPMAARCVRTPRSSARTSSSRPANKQLNFLQHIMTILDINGRAAVVLPDNVLFEGGAGETLRRKLLADFDLHTMLRLPTGIFYAQGVKANVLFFDKKPASEQPWTKKLWVYDLRTNQHFTLKQNPLRRHHLEEFVECYLRRQGARRTRRDRRRRPLAVLHLRRARRPRQGKSRHHLAPRRVA